VAPKLLLGMLYYCVGYVYNNGLCQIQAIVLCLVRKVGGGSLVLPQAQISELGWNMGTRVCMYPAHSTLFNDLGVALHNDP
jgi:hypothetical protein